MALLRASLTLLLLLMLCGCPKEQKNPAPPPGPAQPPPPPPPKPIPRDPSDPFDPDQPSVLLSIYRAEQLGGEPRAQCYRRFRLIDEDGSPNRGRLKVYREALLSWAKAHPADWGKAIDEMARGVPASDIEKSPDSPR